MKWWSLSLAVAVFAAVGAVAFSHDFPGEFDKAKFVCSSSLELEEGNPIVLRHNAMHWRPEILQMARTDKRFKDFSRRVGELENHLDITLGGAKLQEGKYDLIVHVSPDDASKFVLQVKPQKGSEGEESQATFGGGTATEEQDHLSMTLVPKGGQGSMNFVLQVRYGNIVATLDGTMGDASAPAAKDGKKKSE